MANQTQGRLAGRIALITGASRGIGAAVAKRFAAEGAHVIITGRNQAGLEEVDDEIQKAGGIPATLLPMNVTDYDKIDQAGAAIHQRFGKLDVLVGNAGLLGTLTPMHQIRIKEWDELIAVNLTANWRLLRSMDPLLRMSDAGRAIFVTSGTTKAPRAYWATYGVTKAALENMIQAYALEITKTNVKANLIDPGPTRTRMRASAYPGEDPDTLKTPDQVAGLFVDLAVPACQRNGEVVRYGE